MAEEIRWPLCPLPPPTLLPAVFLPPLTPHSLYLLPPTLQSLTFPSPHSQVFVPSLSLPPPPRVAAGTVFPSQTTVYWSVAPAGPHSSIGALDWSGKGQNSMCSVSGRKCSLSWSQATLDSKGGEGGGGSCCRGQEEGGRQLLWVWLWLESEEPQQPPTPPSAFYVNRTRGASPTRLMGGNDLTLDVSKCNICNKNNIWQRSWFSLFRKIPKFSNKKPPNLHFSLLKLNATVYVYVYVGR